MFSFKRRCTKEEQYRGSLQHIALYKNTIKIPNIMFHFFIFIKIWKWRYKKLFKIKLFSPQNSSFKSTHLNIQTGREVSAFQVNFENDILLFFITIKKKNMLYFKISFVISFFRVAKAICQIIRYWQWSSIWSFIYITM